MREKWNALTVGLRNKELANQILTAIFWKWANLRIHAFIKPVTADKIKDFETFPNELKSFAAQRNRTDFEHLKKASHGEYLYKQLTRTISVVQSSEEIKFGTLYLF